MISGVIDDGWPGGGRIYLIPGGTGGARQERYRSGCAERCLTSRVSVSSTDTAWYMGLMPDVDTSPLELKENGSAFSVYKSSPDPSWPDQEELHHNSNPLNHKISRLALRGQPHWPHDTTRDRRRGKHTSYPFSSSQSRDP